jgi:signal transduction histidine kinase
MRRFAPFKKAIGLILATLGCVLLIGINETGYQLSTQATYDVVEAQQTRGAVNRLIQRTLDAETGQRGYLLTGDTRYLEPYELSTKEISQDLDSLRQHYVHDADGLANFDLLSRHLSRKLAEMDLSVRMRREGNEDAWKFVLTTDVGKEQMDSIREQSARLLASSNRKMDAGQAQITKTLQTSRIAIAVVALAGLLAFYLYLKQTTALKLAGEREQESLKRERDQLGRQVRERTERLAALATHLQQVREEERGNLARELHDELGSLLTAAKLDVARIKSRQAGAAPEVAERLQHLTDTLNSGIALSRRIIEDLRPSSLSNLGLVPSLEILAREFGERSGLNVVADFEPVEIGGAAQLTLYRLLQESLTNIGKYAEARHVTILLQDYDSYVSIQVDDDGRGFDPDATNPGSHGLEGMRHRVEAAGGRLTITSTTGQGTRVFAVLPKPHKDATST